MTKARQSYGEWVGLVHVGGVFVVAVFGMGFVIAAFPRIIMWFDYCANRLIPLPPGY